jgi:hypothetical protein
MLTLLAPVVRANDPGILGQWMLVSPRFNMDWRNMPYPIVVFDCGEQAGRLFLGNNNIGTAHPARARWFRQLNVTYAVQDGVPMGASVRGEPLLDHRWPPGDWEFVYLANGMLGARRFFRGRTEDFYFRRLGPGNNCLQQKEQALRQLAQEKAQRRAEAEAARQAMLRREREEAEQRRLAQREKQRKERERSTSGSSGSGKASGGPLEYTLVNRHDTPVYVFHAIGSRASRHCDYMERYGPLATGERVTFTIPAGESALFNLRTCPYGCGSDCDPLGESDHWGPDKLNNSLTVTNRDGGQDTHYIQ